MPTCRAPWPAASEYQMILPCSRQLQKVLGYWAFHQAPSAIHHPMTAQLTLVLGTHNQKKRRELNLLFQGMAIELKTLDEFENSIEVNETGTSFAENAALKATEQAQHLGQWVLGEDSGLSVLALDGRPGVYSSRFAGENATDEDNNRQLIEQLANVPLEKRTAYYTCHMCLADPQGKIWIDVQGRCYGRIRFERQGTAGFGYDPYFDLPEYHQSFGQLGDAVKSILSHRARAMRLFLGELERLNLCS